jgi:mitochondrial fission protein ELM1
LDKPSDRKQSSAAAPGSGAMTVTRDAEPARPAHDPGGGGARHPRIWVVVGDKLGDNKQVFMVLDALGWPYELKALRFRARYVHGKPRFRASIAHLEPDVSVTLAPPWPELVITIGRRPSMAALWIRRQSQGHARVVMIGRPRRFGDLALGVATPQYDVPEADNLMHLDFPLMRVDEAAVAAAGARLAPLLAELARPLTAVLVGGRTAPFVLDEAVARGLLEQVREACPEGSVYFSTSRRTPPEVTAVLRASLRPQDRLYEWRAEDPGNPYLGLLALADRIVVTGDSISMMMEAAALGRPLAIFDLPAHMTPRQRLERRIVGRLDPARGRLRAVKRGLFARGLVSFPRDLRGMQEKLIRRGLAKPLAAGFSAGGGRLPDEARAVAARIRALMAGREP